MRTLIFSFSLFFCSQTMAGVFKLQGGDAETFIKSLNIVPRAESPYDSTVDEVMDGHKFKCTKRTFQFGQEQFFCDFDVDMAANKEGLELSTNEENGYNLFAEKLDTYLAVPSVVLEDSQYKKVVQKTAGKMVLKITTSHMCTSNVVSYNVFFKN